MTSKNDAKSQAVRLHSNRYVPENVNFNLSPIIFLHGLFSNSGTWTNVKRKIADETRRVVYAIDLRNHGRSEYSDVLNMEALTADLDNFIILQKFFKVVLIGHSIGGRVCICYSLKKPEIVEKLIIEESIVSIPPDNFMKNFRRFFKMVTAGIALLPASMSEKQASDMVLQIWNQQMPKDIGGINYDGVLLALHKDKNGKFQFLFNVEAATKAVNEERPFEIDLTKDQVYMGPCFIIYSPRSPLNALGDIVNIKKYFPNAQMHALERGYHILHAECPEEYCEVAIFFVNKG